MAHILTGIPIGGRVTLWAMARFQQQRFNPTTGAIRVEATKPAYPIRVSVRPGGGAPMQTRSGMKNFGPLGPNGEASVIQREVFFNEGGDIDYMIRSADDRREEGSSEYMTTRHHDRAMVVGTAVQASRCSETDIYNRVFCVGNCGNLVESTQVKCEECDPRTKRLCAAMRLAANGMPAECMNPRYEAFEVCFMHATEQGLLVETPVPPVRRKRASTFSAPSPSSGGALTKRHRAPHRDGCVCIACSRRRASQERQTSATG